MLRLTIAPEPATRPSRAHPDVEYRERTFMVGAVLDLLKENEGATVAHRDVLRLWGAGGSKDTARHTVLRARRYLAAHEPGLRIVTVAGVGYRLERSTP